MKRVFRPVAYVASILLLIFSGRSVVSAVSYDVSASVPYPVPTQAATINPLLNNVTVQNAAFVISGTCQTLAPVSIISVWRGATILGSQNCTSSTFSLQVALSEGLNTLVVRTANVSNVYGPDSTPISVTLRTPVAPTPPSTPPQTTPGANSLTPADNTAFNNAASTGLSIVPQDPFSILPPSNVVNLSFYIDGGSTPYTIELNWGDGTTETKVVEKPGNYTFTHQYRNPGNYAVKGRVRDVLGAITEISHSVVVAKPVDQAPKVVTIHAKTGNSVTTWAQKHWVPLTVGTAAFAATAAAYVLGQTAAMHAASAAGQAQVKPPHPRKAPKLKAKGKR